jgi:hypothetical protein
MLLGRAGPSREAVGESVAQHCAPVSRFSFSFIILEICINFKNA